MVEVVLILVAAHRKESTFRVVLLNKMLSPALQGFKLIKIHFNIAIWIKISSKCILFRSANWSYCSFALKSGSMAA